jgi:hypothetical protein
LTGVPRLSRIAVDFDKYRRGTDVRVGTIMRRVSSQCMIRWEGDPEIYSCDEGDVRYWVDSGRARISQPKKRNILEEKRLP